MVTLTIARADVVTTLSRTLLDGTVSACPADVTETCSIIAYAMACAIVFALSHLAVLPCPAWLACACAIETVAVVACAPITLNKSTVAAVVARITYTATALAHAMAVAVACTAEIDCAGRATPPIGAEADSINTHTMITCLARADGAVIARIPLAAEAGCVRLACAVLAALFRAHLVLALDTCPPRIALAFAVDTLAMSAGQAAHLNAAVTACVEACAEALSIATLTMTAAIVGALLLRAVVTSESWFTGAYKIHTLTMTRASIRADFLGTVKAGEARLAHADGAIAFSMVVAIVGTDCRVAG